MDLDPAKTKLAAGIIEPLAIALRELTLGSLLQATNRNDDDAHAHAGSMRGGEMTPTGAISERFNQKTALSGGPGQSDF
jgi:hypothetical protein